MLMKTIIDAFVLVDLFLATIAITEMMNTFERDLYDEGGNLNG